ncbi:class F sortase [Rothia terrae]|uniref:class F sortase n=1 Tax=Rothia terrae TaxID=396015 RepID=UPI0037F7DBF1
MRSTSRAAAITLLMLSLSACSTDVAEQSSLNPEPTVSVDPQGAKWAPAPDHEFRNATCDLSPDQEAKFPTQPAISIPSIGESPLEQNTELTFPEAPAGMWWSQSPAFGEDTSNAATVTAGHVDYSPGTLSQNGGELSPLWGNLHSANECEHVFVTDFNGEHHEYVITSKYIVKQTELYDQGILSRPGLEMITCSGKTLKDVGNENQFNYENNLVVEAQHIKGGR